MTPSRRRSCNSLCSTRDQLADGLTKISNATQYLNMRAVMLNL